MQNDPSMDPTNVLRVTEAGIYGLLTTRDAQRPWSIRELELEVSRPISVRDAIASLYGAGLIHQCGEFVWATRAALAADAIEL
jgi:hypothetical protein